MGFKHGNGYQPGQLREWDKKLIMMEMLDIMGMELWEWSAYLDRYGNEAQ